MLNRQIYVEFEEFIDPFRELLGAMAPNAD